MTNFQRFVGFLSFLLVCFAIWMAVYFLMHPMPAGAAIGFLVGIISYIIAVNIFDDIPTPGEEENHEP